MYFEGETWTDVFKTANDTINTVKKWLDQHLLTLNIQKTQYITFSINNTGQPQNTYTIKIHETKCNAVHCSCSELKRVKSIRYLGVIIDNHLKWDEHIKLTATRIRQTGFKIKQLRSILNPSLLRQVYFSLVQSIVQYGILAWGGTFETYIKILTRAIRMILKIAMNRPWRYPSDLLFPEFDVPTVKILYVQELLIFAHKNLPSLPQITHHYSTRHRIQNNIYITRIHKQIQKHSPDYFAVKLYNQIPLQIKLINDSKRYKKETRKWIRSLTTQQIENLFM